jgi:hypothetical protein
MDADQRQLALEILDSSLAPDIALKTRQIIEHELVLGPLEVEQDAVSFVRDPELYYWTVFGEPGGDGPWGWRAEGHHVSLHINAWGEKVISVTPFFLGANPAEVYKGPKQGLRILDRREDLAFELINSFDARQRARAIIHDKAPWDIPTYNSSKAAVHDNEGISGSEMTGTQKETLMSLIAEYVSGVRAEIAEDRMADLHRQHGLDQGLTGLGSAPGQHQPGIPDRPPLVQAGALRQPFRRNLQVSGRQVSEPAESGAAGAQQFDECLNGRREQAELLWPAV